MSPAKRGKSERRVFRVHVLSAGDDGLRLRLEESLGDQDIAFRVAASTKITRRLGPDLISLLQAARVKTDRLAPTGERPIALPQPIGVRLALLLMACAPMRRFDRTQAIARGITGMGDEEAYYWYARCRNASGSRALRALRILLADA
jgi:hypothetical protein